MLNNEKLVGEKRINNKTESSTTVQEKQQLLLTDWLYFVKKFLIEFLPLFFPTSSRLPACVCINRISKTFCFSNRGHGLYLATPTEIQKFTLCSEFR
jgi:hypothetical protein